MKKLFYTSLICLLSIGSIAAQKQITDVSLLGFDVKLIHSNECKYEYDKNLDVEVKETGSKLYIKYNYPTSKKSKRVALTLYINTANIEELNLANCKLIYDEAFANQEIEMNISVGSDVKFDNVTFKSCKLDVNSGSDVEIKRGKIGNSSVVVSSGALAEINAKAEKVTASTSSGSRAELNLTCPSIKVSSSSGSSIQLEAVSSKIIASASSGANIHIEGSTDNLKANASSGGSINAKKLETKNIDKSASSGGHISTK